TFRRVVARHHVSPRIVRVQTSEDYNGPLESLGAVNRREDNRVVAHTARGRVALVAQVLLGQRRPVEETRERCSVEQRRRARELDQLVDVRDVRAPAWKKQQGGTIRGH